MYYLNYFFIISIFGHFIESFFYSSGDSGILLGYWTPIYGISTLIILLINKYIDKIKTNKIIKIFLLFIMSSFTLAIIEILGGYIIKWIFNKELWDYSNHRFNIGKYTSIEMALIWGLGSILLVYFIKPLIDKFLNKIPKIVTYIFIILFFIDCIATLIIKTI